MLFAFDVLELDGTDLRQLPLIARKDSLRKALGTAQRIRPIGHFERDGVTLFQHAAQNGIEGIVSEAGGLPIQSRPLV